MKNSKKIILLIIALFMLLGTNPAKCVQSNLTEQLNKIETSIWGFGYKKDDVSKRLSRIENNVFGGKNESLSSEARVKKIIEALGIESIEDSKKSSYEILQDEVGEVNYPQIDTLEQQLFNTMYQKENIYKRLERLEKKIFGSVQDGDLAMRTDRLKTYIHTDTVAKSNMQTYYEQPYTMTKDIEQYMGSQSRYSDSDIYIELAGLEMILFSKTFSQDPVGLRLNRLERRIFQRDFSSDDEALRLQRLQAAANAKRTAKLYEANKIQKLTSTGIQLGSIIMMILAIIL